MKALPSHRICCKPISSENEIAALVLEKTEGVPFFIEEFVKSLRDLGIIEVQEGRFRMTAKAALHLPSSIQDIITARVDALPESAKQVLKTAAVIEREFGYELIKRVTGYQEDELAAGLSVLKDAELIYQRGIFPETTYIFKHALTMEVVYASLLTSQRQELHRKVGKAIEDCITMTQLRSTARHWRGILPKAVFLKRLPNMQKLRPETGATHGAYTDAIAHAKNLIHSLEQLPVSSGNPKTDHRCPNSSCQLFIGFKSPSGS